MKQLDMAKVVKRYNQIMVDCGWEHRTIGTRFSQDTQGWGLPQMVAEAKYLLGCYYEPGHSRYEDRNLDAYMHKAYLSETGKLKRFIATYKKYC